MTRVTDPRVRIDREARDARIDGRTYDVYVNGPRRSLYDSQRRFVADFDRAGNVWLRHGASWTEESDARAIAAAWWEPAR